MPESIKDLIEKRNKAVHDARQILDREKNGGKLGADEIAKADELLDQAGNLDAQIEERRKGEARESRLKELEERQKDDGPRQVPPSRPGEPMPRRTQPSQQALTVQLGRHEATLRPGQPGYERATEAYRDAFGAYLRGDFVGRSGHESLGLSVGDNSKGGYLVPMTQLGGMIKFLDDMVFMRQLATVLPPTEAKSVGALSFDTDYADADWTAEVPASDISEDDAARFGSREMTPHQLTKLAKVSRKVLRSSTMDLENFINQRFAYKFGITEEKAFLTGSGAQRPLGVFTASNDGITTSQDVTASAATSFTADDLINVLYDLKGAYQMRATWLMSREGIKRTRKLKTGEGQYIWQPGLSGQPGTILDRPYVMSEYVPSTYTTGQYVAAVGDFSHYYIQDGTNLEVQRLDELFSLRNQVGFLGRKETDGMPVLAEAFRRLKLA